MLMTGWGEDRRWLLRWWVGALFCFFVMGRVMGQDKLHGNETRVFVIGMVAPGGIDGEYCRDAVDGYLMFIEHMHEIRAKRTQWMMMQTMNESLPFDFNLRIFESVDELKKNHAKDPVHFLVGCEGWKSDIATSLAEFSFKHSLILLRCCSPEDLTAHDSTRNIFDMQPGSGRFVELLIRSLVLRSIVRFAVVYEEDNVFHTNTCSEAIKLINDYKDVVGEFIPPVVVHYNKTDERPGIAAELFPGVATEGALQGIEAVIACLDEHDSEALVKSFDDIRYPLKALYLTDGPSNAEWVKKLGNLTEDLLTSTQWTRSSHAKDGFYGGARGFVKKMESMISRTRNVTADQYQLGAAAAIAATSGYVLADALKSAFRGCDIPEDISVTELLNELHWCSNRPQDSGQLHVLNSLRNTNLQTIIGQVKFDSENRNDMFPMTVQIDVSGKDRVVLPVAGYLTLNAPARNRYIEFCKPGERVSPNKYEVCLVCPKGTHSLKKNSPQCNPCVLGYYADKEGMDKCQSCPEGMTTLSEASSSADDCVCEAKYYLAKNTTRTGCVKCAPGASCKGGTELPVASAGYWSGVASGEVYECDPPSICLGENQCLDGWEGKLCAKCNKGHFKLVDNCQKCPPKLIFVCILMLLYIGWYMVNMVVSESMASLDMLLGFAQLANVIGDVGLRWPSTLETTFGVTNILDFDLDILWPSCLMQSWSFAHNFYVQLLFPLTMGLMALFGYMSSRISLKFTSRTHPYKRSRLFRWAGLFIYFPLDNEQLSQKWDSTIAAFIAAIEVSYVTVTKYLFDVFKCTLIDGERVLEASPDIVCGSTAHNYMVGGACIGIFFYTVGYVVFVAGKLMEMHHNRSYPNPRNVRRYGFLYERFEPGYIWMATFVLVRRLAFVAVLVFMGSPAFQAATLALLVTGSLMVHVYTAPYVDTYLDVLFSFLLVALMFETFGGLMFFSDNLPKHDRNIMECFIIGVMSLVGFVFIVIFAIELRQKYLIHRLRKLHLEAVLGKLYNVSSDDGDGKDEESQHPRKTEKSEVSDELLQTFQPEFLYRALNGWEEGLQDWDRLTDKLKLYMSDGSETSYLSTDNIAQFWRRLVAKFPELIDFLAITDSTTRGHFVAFVRALYTDYFLKKRVDKLQIFSVLNWRDRAPLAHWLSSCPEADREFFTVFMAQMFQRAHGSHASDAIVEKVKQSGSMWFDESTMSSANSSVYEDDRVPSLDTIPKQIRIISANSAQALWFMKSHRESSIREEIENGYGPLHHSAHSTVTSTVAYRYKSRMAGNEGSTRSKNGVFKDSMTDRGPHAGPGKLAAVSEAANQEDIHLSNDEENGRNPNGKPSMGFSGVPQRLEPPPKNPFAIARKHKLHSNKLPRVILEEE